MATQLIDGRFRGEDAAGLPLVGGLLYTYASGTTTPKAAYTDSTLGTATTNPVVLNARGEAQVWLGSGAYSLKLTDSTGTTIWTTDGVVSADPAGSGQAAADALRADLAETTGAAMIGLPGGGTLADAAAAYPTISGLDGSGAVATTNVTVLTAAASLGKSFRVPPPATSYYLSSNPTIPSGVQVIASPSWFSGPGKMPAHLFAELSEGVDPRVFDIPDLTYAQTPPSNTRRVWAKAGWVKVGTSPASGYEGTQTDAVGVDGRAVVTANKGRGWALVGLAQMESGPTDPSTQAYAAELDVNNNDVDVSSFDQGKATRGLVAVSGGSKRPAEALYVMSTYPMLDGAKDNRWFCGMRFLPTSFYKYGVFFQDGALPAAGTGGANISLCYGGKIEFRPISGPAPSVRSDADQVLWTLGNGGMTWRNAADTEYIAALSNAGVLRAKHLAAGMALITDTSTAAALDATQGGQIQIQPASTRTITSITTAEDQQLVWLLFLNSNTTIQHNAAIQLAGHANYTPTAGSTLTLMRWGSVMREMSRSVY